MRIIFNGKEEPNQISLSSCNQFAPYVNKYKKSYLLGGNKSPIQKLKAKIVKAKLSKTNYFTNNEGAITHEEPIYKILDLARWAPSGDNTQPWHFKVIDNHTFYISIQNPIKDDVYDFDGIPITLGLGCLLETCMIAANKYKHFLDWSYVKLKPFKVRSMRLDLGDLLL